METLRKELNESLGTLTEQLTEFGLNPRDWKILPKGKGFYKVQYSEDEAWYFYGMAKQDSDKTKWSYLRLASL